VAPEDERHGLPLDRGGHAVSLMPDPAVHVLAQSHRLEPARLGLLGAAARARLGLLRSLRRLLHRRGVHGGCRGIGLLAGVGFGRGTSHGWEGGGEMRVGFRALLWSAAAARRWGCRRRGGVNLGSEAETGRAKVGLRLPETFVGWMKVWAIRLTTAVASIFYPVF
jgi:hypothetical protein